MTDPTDRVPPSMLDLASNRLFWRLGDPYVYPYGVSIDFRESPPVVWVWEGVTHSAAAARLTAREAVMPRWADLLVKAEAEWLRPYLQRLARGEAVNQAELVAHFRLLHGRDPDVRG